MIASVHIANLGLRQAASVLRRAPRPAEVDGLRHADVAITAPLGGSVLPAPDLRRVGLIALWDSDAALDAFLDRHPLAGTLGGGWQVRLDPLRAWGSWPGLPSDLTRSRTVPHAGPAVVLTLGRVKLRRLLPFLRASARAEEAVVSSPGMTWATGLARPPFVSTCSLWESSDALAAYAYGHARAPHPAAMQADRAEPFHHQSAFVRWRPRDARGHLEGRNPLPETWSASV